MPESRKRRTRGRYSVRGAAYLPGGRPPYVSVAESEARGSGKVGLAQKPASTPARLQPAFPAAAYGLTAACQAAWRMAAPTASR